MQFHALLTLSLPFVIQDVLVAVGAGVALLASLVFINLGLLLPGLLTALGEQYGDAHGCYLEFGPASAPVISDPSPPPAAPPETDGAPRHVTRPHLWGLSLRVRSHI